MSNIYDKLSEERKKLQEDDLAPYFFTTSGWQLYKEKYLYQANNPREQFQRIASTLAMHTPDPNVWKEKFFNLLWKGWLSPSTPVHSNTGTTRGLPVSCAGSYFPDSIDGIYKAKHETAMLTKHGFGTSGYLGDIRHRGAPISSGGKSLGIVPILQGMQSDMEYVAQSMSRRGSWAGYVPLSHGDFDEVCSYLYAEPEGNNIGWNIYDSDIEKLNNGDQETLRRYGRVLKTKMVTGQGYFMFPDKINRKRPQWYVDHNLDVKASNLCTEITLHSSEDYTFTCVLSSMNLDLYEEWKDTDAVFVATVFLDCVVQEFIERAKNIGGLEKAVAFTKKSRALGLGVCGWHSLCQRKFITVDSLEAYALNTQIFKHLREEAEKATEWLASVYGEPEWCKGYNRANSHLLSIAPTKSTALIMGGISEGINLDTAMAFTQSTPAGEMSRINPHLLTLMKRKGVYNKKNVKEIIDAMGSVQGVDWLTPEEKLVFRTAFEYDQMVILRQAETRGKYLDQWQSLNLFIPEGEDEAKIAKYHEYAFKSEGILGLYYTYSKAGVQASDDKECVVCQ